MKNMSLMTRMGIGMMSLMQPLMPSCKDVTQMISDSMDQRLSWYRRTGIKIHLMMCDLCRRYEQHLGIIRHSVHVHSHDDSDLVGPSLKEASRDRIKTALRDAQ